MNGIRLFAVSLTMFLLAPLALARASVLDEWALPTGVVEADVDAHTGVVYLVQAAPAAVIDKLDPVTGVLTHYDVGTANLQFTQPGGIVQSDDARYVYVTDATHTSIGRLDATTGAFTRFTLPLTGGAQPHALVLDPVDRSIWFTAYGASSTAVVGNLDPTTGALRLWAPNAMPAGVHLDGISALFGSGPTAYVPVPGTNVVVQVTKANTVSTWIVTTPNASDATPVHVGTPSHAPDFAFPSPALASVRHGQPPGAVNLQSIGTDSLHVYASATPGHGYFTGHLGASDEVLDVTLGSFSGTVSTSVVPVIWSANTGAGATFATAVQSSISLVHTAPAVTKTVSGAVTRCDLRRFGLELL